MKRNEADQKLTSEILNLQANETTFLFKIYSGYYTHWYDYPVKKETQILIICESPPMPDVSMKILLSMNDSEIAKVIPYFYNEDCPPDCRRRAFKVAVSIFDGIDCGKWWDGNLRMRNLFLRNFRNEGFLLIDLCTYPVNKIKGKRRGQVRSWYHEDILNRIEKESPAQGIIIMGEDMGNPLKPLIENLGNGSYNGRCHVIPDPRRKGGVEAFRSALNALEATHLVLSEDIPTWEKGDAKT
jgi:hypothetical protein